MANGTLILHTGAREVPYDNLPQIAPNPTRTWYPVAHKRIVDTCLGTLEASGYQVTAMRFGLTSDDHRLFGVLDLKTPLVEGVSLAVGIRNSTNKSFPLGFCAGARVFVCDNLAFRSELLVKRKHTRYGEMRFNNAIASAVTALASFKEAEASRITKMRHHAITDETAAHYLLRSMEEGIVSAPRLPDVWKTWKEPKHDYGPPTLWGLLNCFTEVLAPRAISAPNEYAGQTIRLNRLLTPGGPFVPEPIGDATASQLSNAV